MKPSGKRRSAARRRVNWEGPALALLTLGGLLGFAVLAVGAMSGSPACAEALVMFAGAAALTVRAPIAGWAAESSRRAFGGSGTVARRVAKVALTVWGLIALFAGAAALVVRLIDAVG
jgi:hypothetical protein